MHQNHLRVRTGKFHLVLQMRRATCEIPKEILGTMCGEAVDARARTLHATVDSGKTSQAERLSLEATKAVHGRSDASGVITTWTYSSVRKQTDASWRGSCGTTQ